MSDNAQPQQAQQPQSQVATDPTTPLTATAGGATVVGAEIANATAQQQADAAAAAKSKKKDAPPLRQDETVAGGRYSVDGVMVDAEGRPLPQ